MKNTKYYLYVTNQEIRIILDSLLALRNRLIRDGCSADMVDRTILKVSKI